MHNILSFLVQLGNKAFLRAQVLFFKKKYYLLCFSMPVIFYNIIDSLSILLAYVLQIWLCLRIC